MSELGGGCVAGHCEEPDQVGEMVSCAGVGCSNQVSAIILDTVRVKVLLWQIHLTCAQTSPVKGKNRFCGPVCKVKSGQGSKRHCVRYTSEHKMSGCLQEVR